MNRHLHTVVLLLIVFFGCQSPNKEKVKKNSSWAQYLEAIGALEIPTTLSNRKFKVAEIEKSLAAKFGRECISPLGVLTKKPAYSVILEYQECLENGRVPMLTTFDSAGNQLDQLVLKTELSGLGMHQIATIRINMDLEIAEDYTQYEYSEEGHTSDTLIKAYKVTHFIRQDGVFEQRLDELKIRSTLQGVYTPEVDTTMLFGEWTLIPEERVPALSFNGEYAVGFTGGYLQLPYRLEGDSLTVFDLNDTYKFRIDKLKGDSLWLSNNDDQELYFKI